MAMTNGGVIISLDQERAAFNRIKELMQQENPGVEFIINQKTLRLENELTPAKSSYVFDMYETRGADRPGEEKLNRNHLFFLTHAAVCLTKQDKTTSPRRFGNYPLFTNPDPNFFVGDDSTNMLEYQALETIFGGKLTVKTSPVVRLEDFLNTNFRYVPERNYTVNSSGNDEYPQYGPTMEEKGFFRLTPQIIIDGQENNTVEVSLGEGDTALIAGGIDAAGDAVDTTNVLVVLLHGFIVVNGAQKVGRWTAR
jgi:hypothetical protein